MTHDEGVQHITDVLKNETVSTRSNSSVLSIIPLGGVGEIGLNMMVLEYSGDIIVIDAGLMFPDAEMLGVDIVIPDFTYLVENRQKVRAVLLTHAHEDHIGALPFLLREIKVPVYGTRLTLGFVKDKLREHDLEKEIELIVVKPREIVDIASFRVEFIRVTHSIVDGVGLGITTPVGCIVHTGDFKIDPTPVDGEVMDLRTFSEYGDKGTLAFFQTALMRGKAATRFRKRGPADLRTYLAAQKEGLWSRHLPLTSIACSKSWTLQLCTAAK